MTKYVSNHIGLIALWFFLKKLEIKALGIVQRSEQVVISRICLFSTNLQGELLSLFENHSKISRQF
jgi:hypothetical protein